MISNFIGDTCQVLFCQNFRLDWNTSKEKENSIENKKGNEMNTRNFVLSGIIEVIPMIKNISLRWYEGSGVLVRMIQSMC